MTAAGARLGGAAPRLGSRGPRALRSLRGVGSGIAAIGAKELRSRMRGKRAFAILSVHLLVLAGFTAMVDSIARSAATAGGMGSITASAEIGRALFSALILLLTLVTLILAPAATAGAISSEREKQTLDLLTTTPISTLAIVIGKLVAALAWILLLVVASVPVTAIVFAFGGVGPEALVKGYLVLLVTALLYGAMGLWVSGLLKRTQAATIVNLVLVIALTGGSTFVYAYLAATSAASTVVEAPARDLPAVEPLPPGADGDDGAEVPAPVPDDAVEPTAAAGPSRPPELLLWLNPFVAQLDVICGTETGSGGIGCGAVAVVTGAVERAPGAAAIADSYWPRSLVVMVLAAAGLLAWTAQLVAPTRRWRLPARPGRPRQRGRGAGAATTEASR